MVFLYLFGFDFSNLCGQLDEKELYSLVHISLESTLLVSGAKKSHETKEPSYEQHLLQTQQQVELFDALDSLLGDILLSDITPVCLDFIFRVGIY